MLLPQGHHVQQGLSGMLVSAVPGVDHRGVDAIGYQMAVARLGLSLVPGLVGNLANVFGLEIIPPLLFINATFMLLLQETISRKQVPLHKS